MPTTASFCGDVVNCEIAAVLVVVEGFVVVEAVSVGDASLVLIGLPLLREY